MSGIVTVHLTQAARKDEHYLDRVRPLLDAGIPIANAIRKRVQGRGETVGNRFQGYDNSKPFWTNSEYAKDAKVQDGTWVTSKDFHDRARAKANHFSTTGKMWEGLQVRNMGDRGVIIDFGGSSIGTRSAAAGRQVRLYQNVEIETSSGTKTVRKFTGKTQTRRKAKLVRNQDKGGLIWSRYRINVLQMSDAETTALQAVIITMARTAVVRAFGNPQGTADGSALTYYGDRDLYHALVRSWLRDDVEK